MGGSDAAEPGLIPEGGWTPTFGDLLIRGERVYRAECRAVGRFGLWSRREWRWVPMSEGGE